MLSHRDIRACVLTAWALGGCVPVSSCPTGELWNGTVCVPEDEACGPGERWDGSGCVGLDAGFDGGGDAGPCGGACGGETPLCDAARGVCVACLEASDCAAPDRACVEGACAGCDDAADCGEADASRCDGATNECAACALDEDCAHLTATPVCDEARGTCAACTADTEGERCGPNACIVATGTCGTRARGSQDTCDACEADSECAPGRRCLEHVFMGTSVGTFCLLDAAGGCGDGDTTRRPYSTRLEATSLGGVTATYCFPPVTTTCAGIRDTRSVACTTDDMCGVPGQNDGYCPTVGSATGACSYRCGGAFDCADPLACAGTPQHCRP